MFAFFCFSCNKIMLLHEYMYKRDDTCYTLCIIAEHLKLFDFIKINKLKTINNSLNN